MAYMCVMSFILGTIAAYGLFFLDSDHGKKLWGQIYPTLRKLLVDIEEIKTEMSEIKEKLAEKRRRRKPVSSAHLKDESKKNK